MPSTGMMRPTCRMPDEPDAVKVQISTTSKTTTAAEEAASAPTPHAQLAAEAEAEAGSFVWLVAGGSFWFTSQ